VVGDEETAIVDALNALRHRYTYIFTTGGIGPTHGDVTADCVAKAFGVRIDGDPQHRPNTNVVLRAHDAQKLAQAKREVGEMLERVRRAQSNSACALSRRKQGFESPRERQSNQVLVSNRPAVPLSFSNFSPNQ
jgi:molybdopterin-biosynthesis enzyme MoeA-like protein